MRQAGCPTMAQFSIADRSGPAESLRACGFSGSKVIYIHALAMHFLENAKAIKRWPDMADEVIIKELTAIKGIGVWTAEMFLIFNLGRMDVFSYGDVGLKNGIELLYDITKPTVEHIESITNCWSPYRSFGCIALWHSVDNRKQ